MWGRRGWIVALVVVLPGVVLAAGRSGASLSAQTPDTVFLVEGCTNVALAYPVGTPLRTVAGSVQPFASLNAIFRYSAELGRFLGFSPTASDAANDYVAITSPLEAVFVCMASPGTIVRSPTGVFVQPAPTPPPIIFGVVSAPRTVRRGETATVVLGTLPGYLCIGGVNIPTTDSTFRFVPITVTASSSGRATVTFDVVQSDAVGFAYLAVRCADGQVIRIDFRVV